MKKKLLENTTWYKDSLKENGEIETSAETNLNTWKKYRKKRSSLKKKKERIEKNKEAKEEQHETYQSVMFIDHTAHSELAQRIREKLKQLDGVTQIKFKIVEKTGDKVVDLLHKSNPWSSEDCQREDCLVCSSSEEGRKGNCKTRCITYEIYCLSCHEKEGEAEEVIVSEIPDAPNDGNKRKRVDRIRKKEKEREDYKVIYIGETKKSAYERGREHLEDLSNLNERSHLLKHLVEVHPTLAVKDLKIGMRIKKSYRSAFE